MQFYFATAAVLIAALPSSAQPAYPKFSYVLQTSGERYELVMLGTDKLPPKWQINYGQTEAELRAKYRKSGLYPMGNTTDPIWTVDEYWDYPTNAYPDGVHAVRMHGGFSIVLKSVQQEGLPTDDRLAPEVEQSALDSPALTFYAKGKPLRTYTVRELLSDPAAAPHGTERILWCETSGLHPETMRYSLSTTDGNTIVFDVTTGEIIGRSKSHHWMIRQAWNVGIGLAAILGVVLVGWIAWWVRRRRLNHLYIRAEPGATNA